MARLFDDDRVYSLLELFSSRLDQAELTRPALAAPDNNPADDREFSAGGLNPNVEYRVTLVREENVDRGAAAAECSLDTATESELTIELLEDPEQEGEDGNDTSRSRSRSRSLRV